MFRARRTELCGPAGDSAQGCVMRFRGLYRVLFLLGLGQVLLIMLPGYDREIVL